MFFLSAKPMLLYSFFFVKLAINQLFQKVYKMIGSMKRNQKLCYTLFFEQLVTIIINYYSQIPRIGCSSGSSSRIEEEDKNFKYTIIHHIEAARSVRNICTMQLVLVPPLPTRSQQQYPYFIIVVLHIYQIAFFILISKQLIQSLRRMLDNSGSSQLNITVVVQLI